MKTDLLALIEVDSKCCKPLRKKKNYSLGSISTERSKKKSLEKPAVYSVIYL